MPNEDLNNIGAGTQLTLNFQSNQRTTGVRTRFIESGVDSPSDMATAAAVVPSATWPGLTGLPVQSSTIQKLDAGRALQIVRYALSGNTNSNPPTWSNLYFDCSPIAVTAGWYGPATDTVPSSGDIDTDYNSTSGDYFSLKALDEMGIVEWGRPADAYLIRIPTVLTTNPVVNSTMIGMINRANSNNFGIGGVTYAPWTLVCLAPQVAAYQTPSGIQYKVWYNFKARRDGWFIQRVKDDDGSPLIQFIPQYPQTSFSALPYFT